MVEWVDWLALRYLCGNDKSRLGIVQPQKISLRTIKQLGAMKVLRKIKKNIKIRGVGFVNLVEKRKNVPSQKQKSIQRGEELIFLNNKNMSLSAFYLILASAIWGIDGYVRQGTLISGSLLIALESSIVGVLLFIFLFLFKKEHIKKIQNGKSMLGIILLGGVGGSWCFAQALSATQSLGFVFVLIGLQPVFTIITSAILLKEHPKSSFYAFAATTIFASVLLTIGDTGFVIDSNSVRAYAYALLTAIFWGSSTTFGKIVITHNSPIYTLALRFLGTGIIGWVIVYFSQDMVVISELVSRISAKPFNILFLIFISDILATGIFYRSLRDMPATIATIFELAFPLTGFILDYILYDVVPSPIKVVAAFTILISIVILPHCHFIEEKNDTTALLA